ncbi:hypothetical protein KIW84_011338, partial [Lathyrus oleraceus]
FTKSAYEAMTVCFEKDDSAEGLYSACNISWRLKILFRIKAFEWRTFFNRLPTKDQLNKRGMSAHDFYHYEHHGISYVYHCSAFYLRWQDKIFKSFVDFTVMNTIMKLLNTILFT